MIVENEQKTSNNAYTVTADMGGDTTLSVNIGEFTNHSDAVSKFKAMVLCSAHRDTIWKLVSADSTYITTSKKAECYYRAGKFTIEGSGCNSFTIYDDTGCEYEITESIMDAVGFTIIDTDSCIYEIAASVHQSHQQREKISIAKIVVALDDLDDAFVLWSNNDPVHVVNESNDYEDFNTICERFIEESVKNNSTQGQ